MTGPDDSAAWEPTAAIVISCVAAIAAVIGIVLAVLMLSGDNQRGLEGIGGFIVALFGLGLTLVSSAVGMIASGIGLKRARNRQVRAPALNVAFVVNLIVFWSTFIIPWLMRN
jgi:hypothetical protein